MKIFKKLISVAVASCFMLSIVNLPVYSAYNTIETIGSAQNQEEYNLQKDYESVKDAASKPKATGTTTSATVSKATVNKTAKQAVTAINKLLKKKGISKLAKTWLKKIKSLINSIKNGKKSNKEKQTLLKKALAAIKKVTKAKGSELSLAQQTVSLGKVFSALKNVLKNNLVYKVYSKYATAGLNVLKKLASKVGLKLKTVFNQFVKYGVTKAQLNKVNSTLLNIIKRGATFYVCSTTALSKYLNISKGLAAIQQVAAEISLNPKELLEYKNKGHYIATTWSAQVKVLQKNGVKNAKGQYVKLSDLISLKNGKKALVNVYCYSKSGKYIGTHAITVARESNGSYGVYDILVNGGNKVVYTQAQFKRLVNGQSAKGKTTSGKTITKSTYLSSADGYISYKFAQEGKVYIVADLNNTTSTTIKTTAKATAATSLTSKIIKKYTKQGLTTLKAFAKKLGLKLKTVYNQFVKYGVTKAQMKKVASGLLKIIKRGANFTSICSTLAVSKYLGISKAFTAVQQIAAEISLNNFNPKSKKHYIATTWTAQTKVLSKNGVKNSEEYYVKLADLLNLKKGSKMLVNADCYNTKGQPDGCHAITITREKNGKYGVYDVLVNGGNKVIYTKTQIKRLLSGKSAKGKTTSGRTITKTKYLATAYGYFSYKFATTNGNILIVGDSSKVITPAAKSSYNKSISLVNKLLKKKGLIKSAKTWLTKAKKLIINTLNSNKSYRKKEDLLDNAYSLLKQVSSKSVSTISLVTGSTSIFSSLKSLLKNTLTYKIYGKYGENGAKVISAIAKKYNLSQSTVYNTFVNNKVTKGQMDFLWDSILNSLKDEDPFVWRYAYSSVNGAMSSIEKLVKPSSASPQAPAAPKAVKKISLTSKIIKKYTKKGLTALKALANKFGFSLKTVYKQFVRYGVTKKDMKKVAPTLIKIVRRGVRLTCCASLAVSKYLGISNKFSAVQNLAADIAAAAKDFVRLHKNERVVVGYASMETVLAKNGKKAEYCGNITIKEFMSNLKAGQKALLGVTCLNRSGSPVDGHAITVVRQKNGKYAVYDVLSNGGNKVVYTAKEFKKFLQGKSAKGKTASGRTVRKPVYYNSTSGYIKYRFAYNGTMSITTDSKQIKQIEIKRSNNYKMAVSKVNKLLKTKNLSSFAKTWLTKAKVVINNILKSNKSNSAKNALFTEAYFALHDISIEKFSIDALMRQTKGVFSPIKSALKNNLTYKIYSKYGHGGMDLINKISSKYKLSKTTVYNAFVNNGVTKKQMENDAYLISHQIERNFDVFSDPWTSSNNIKKALAAIKKLVNSETTNNNVLGESNNNSNSIENQIKTKYGDEGTNLINELSTRYNLDKTAVYKKFVEHNVTKEQLYDVGLTDDLKDGINIFNTGWGPSYSNVGDALAAIKQLIDTTTTQLAA